jgi:hypothetical protein
MSGWERSRLQSGLTPVASGAPEEQRRGKHVLGEVLASEVCDAGSTYRS